MLDQLCCTVGIAGREDSGDEKRYKGVLTSPQPANEAYDLPASKSAPPSGKWQLQRNVAEVSNSRAHVLVSGDFKSYI
jgi:hypothetical protein